MRRLLFVPLLFFILPLSIAEEKMYYLESGDKIKGVIVFEDKEHIEIKTSMGKVRIKKSQIKPQYIHVHLKNGSRIKGVIIEQTDKIISIKTGFGKVDIKTNDIGYLEYTSESALDEVALSHSNNKSADNWYFSDEQLIDVWFDPTGFTLKNSELYFSALSWGVGITDRIQVTSSWFRYFEGDFNVRPKIMVFEEGDINSRQAVSVGADFHSGGQPDKYEFKRFKRKETTYPDDKINDNDANTPIEKFYDVQEWIQVGDKHYKNLDYGSNEDDQFWGELFVAYTLSNLRGSGQGRINYTFGASMTYYPDYNIMPRVYAAVDIDILKSLKVMAEVFYDPYYVPMHHDHSEELKLPIFFDIGFLTNKLFSSKNIWVGVHFQKPVISVYYKF